MQPSSEDEEEEANATCYRSQAHAEYHGTSGVVSKVTTMPGSGSRATNGAQRGAFVDAAISSSGKIATTDSTVGQKCAKIFFITKNNSLHHGNGEA